MRKLLHPACTLVDRRDVRVRAVFAIARRAVRVDDAAGAEDLLLPRAVVDRDVRGASRSAASRARSISFKGKPAADRLAVSAAELTVLFGADRPGHRPLWGRKAWGVWWQWDARLTMALLLELIFIAYLLVRKYGGPGIGEARRGDGALRHRRRAVRLQVGEHLADDPSARPPWCRRCGQGMCGPVLRCGARVPAAVRGAAARCASRLAERQARARRPVSGARGLICASLSRPQ